MERHDSVPEEQPRRFAGSDLDHIIRLNSFSQGSEKDARDKRARNALLIDEGYLAFFWPRKEPGGLVSAVKTVNGVLGLAGARAALTRRLSQGLFTLPQWAATGANFSQIEE
jgi:hypothetical protein